MKVERKSGEGVCFGREMGRYVDAPSTVEMAALGGMGQGHLSEEPRTFGFFRVGKYSESLAENQ